MPAPVLVPVLFALFYFLPGAVLLSNTTEIKRKRFETLALATLLSQLAAPLTLSLLGRVVPGNDGLLMAGYIAFWALALAGVLLWPQRVRKWLPDFGALPKADKGAWIVSTLLAALVIALRFNIFQGYASPVWDDRYHLTKLTSIAATGLPSLYARQPLYPFAYYDLDYIAPGLWARFAEGAVGIATAWVVHVGVQTFAVSLFFTRLIYRYAKTGITRLFGLLALHVTTGLDLLLTPWVYERQMLLSGRLYLEGWSHHLNWFDEFILIAMPINFYAGAIQHVLGMAVVGLMFFVLTTRRPSGLPQAAAMALLLAALFRVSAFIFLGALPGLALWYLSELLTGRDRMRQLALAAVTGLAALALVFPFLSDILSKQSYLDFGLRSFVFLDIPFLPWLKYPITGFVYLLFEIGILLPLLLWKLLSVAKGQWSVVRDRWSGADTPNGERGGGVGHRSQVTGRRPQGFCSRPLRFWLCMAVGLLIPFVVQTPLFNDIASRGVKPAQLAAVMVGCRVLAHWAKRRRHFVTALVALQCALSVAAAGTEMFFHFSAEQDAIPATSRWVARNTPLSSLLFYERPRGQSGQERLLELSYGQRLGYETRLRRDDALYITSPESGWKCLPAAHLRDADSLCSIAAQIPGAQPVYVKLLDSSAPLDSDAFTLVHEADGASLYALSCPAPDAPARTTPPLWRVGPFSSLHALLNETPADHAIAAGSDELADWARSETNPQRLFRLVPDRNGPGNALSRREFLRAVMPARAGAALAERQYLHDLLGAVDASAAPVWFLLDYHDNSVWSEKIYAHIQDNYYVAQPNAARSQWLPCNQRVVLALPRNQDELRVAYSNISFDGQIVVNAWRAPNRPHRAGEIVPMELVWRQAEEGRFKFFVHLLDEEGTLHAQIDLAAVDDGSAALQTVRMGLYLPPDLPAGPYQIHLGVYRPEDGRRLALPNGKESLPMPLTVAP